MIKVYQTPFEMPQPQDAAISDAAISDAAILDAAIKMPHFQAPKSTIAINGTKTFTESQKNGLAIDCIKRRDKMFNDIILYSFVISKIGTFLVGIVIDRFGIFFRRCISSSMSLVGYLSMSVKYPFLLWIS